MTGQQVEQSTVTLLTPRGRGAVATIRVCGNCQTIDSADPSLFQAANGRRMAQQPVGRICFGHWGEQQQEDVVVCRISNDVVEIHCHGGDAAVGRILEDLKSAGCCVQPWFDSLVETASIFEAELHNAVSRATTLRTAEILLRQQSGLLHAAIKQLIPVEWTSEEIGRVTGRLDGLIRRIDFGRHLTSPWNVVIAGRPNVGKSSLINALVGFSRSIVFDQPGTTRDVVDTETAFQGWPVRLADTAGIRDSADKLESAGIELARERLADADCRILLLDISQEPLPEDDVLLVEWPNSIVVAHKCDLPDLWNGRVPQSAIQVSSLTKHGLENLVDCLINRLIPAIPPDDAAVPVTKRQTDLLLSARTAIGRNDETEFRTAVQQLLN